jgi:hypothetical protein
VDPVERVAAGQEGGLMGWVKLDDAFLDHPKFLEAGPLAGYLCIAAIAWSNRNLTDGFVPRAQVRRLVDFDGIALSVFDGELSGVVEDADAVELAERLCACKLWGEVEGGWRIHDYHEWQRTSEEIIAARDDARARQRRSRATRTESAARHSVADVSQRDFSVTNAPVTGVSQRDTPVTHSEVTAVSQPCHSPEEGRRKKEETPMSSELDVEPVSSRDVPAATRAAQPASEDESQPRSLIARRLFEHWRTAVDKPASKFTADRRAKVESRLRDGYTEQQIRQAIDGAARAAFVNDAGKRFDDLELICRNGSKLEDFMSRAVPALGEQSMSSAELVRRFRGDAA